jgi:transcriptional regulator with XRE-family HTH domain
MSQWRPLPQDLDPEVRLLIERLRELKDRSGLSLASLAGRTAYSKSSWERYLNGKALPTRQAVRALGEVAGADAGRLEALRASAELAWSRRGDATPPKDEAAEDIPAKSASEVPQSPDVPSAYPQQTGSSPRTALRLRGPAGPRRRVWWAAAGTTVVVVLGLLWVSLAGSAAGGRDGGSKPSATSGEVLFSPACEPVVSIGQHDTCVREVQMLLRNHGTTIAVDGDFGPETLRRVTVFQVLAGLPDTGVVDQATAMVLYSKRVSMTTWSPRQVEQRIREVFTEAPDEAVAIARCQSFLDPLYELPNANGTRNWGVFQISDMRLADLGGTPRQAIDPEWNIQAAHKLFQRDHGFSDWMFCEGAYSSASASPKHP